MRANNLQEHVWKENIELRTCTGFRLIMNNNFSHTNGEYLLKERPCGREKHATCTDYVFRTLPNTATSSSKLEVMKVIVSNGVRIFPDLIRGYGQKTY